MKNLQSFDEFVVEGFTKYDMSHLVGDDLKDKKAVESFVELHNPNGYTDRYVKSIMSGEFRFDLLKSMMAY